MTKTFHPDSPVFGCAEIREFDRRAIESFRIPGILLMENAGRVLTETLIAAMPQVSFRSPILILAGRGNNGGDGFVMARHLQRLGYQVNVLAIGDPGSWKGDAKTNLEILEKLTDHNLFLSYFQDQNLTESFEQLRSLLEQADIVVDAILGTGTHGPLRFPANEIIPIINAAKKEVFAVDIPSGLDGDTGVPIPEAVQAKVTCTLAAFKKGFAQPGASLYTGKIYLGDIGVSSEKLI